MTMRYVLILGWASDYDGGVLGVYYYTYGLECF